MGKTIRAAMLATLMAIVPLAQTASAAPTEQCFRGPLNHSAMAGQYEGDDASFWLNIYPCGGRAELFWTNPYGQEYSLEYYTVDTLRGGGWIGRIVPGQYGVGPWDTTALGYKPAERGAIQILFWDDRSQELIVRHGIKVR